LHASALAPLVLALAFVVSACQPADGRVGEASRDPPGQGPAKTIVITTINAVAGFQVMARVAAGGGWRSTNEMHSHGLFTTGLTTRKVEGLLVEKVPSLEDGSIALLPDGQMRVVYPLRRGITWHDGAPFTAQDLVFSARFLQDRGMPTETNTTALEITAVEAPDDHTFIATYRSTYYGAISHPITSFWPVPRHIVEPLYEQYLASGNTEEIINHPYWTSEYVHLGPFRLASWDPSREITFHSYPGYFRGAPRVDTIRVQVHLNLNSLFAGLLAGTSDLFFENTLDLEQGAQLEKQWGALYLKPSNIRILVPQFRPAYQREPANLDPRVRAALYHALDREELAEGLQLGHRETAAWGHLLPSDPLFEAGKDTFRGYTYDPVRARAILADLGWTPGPDGILRSAPDGRRFHTSISVLPDYQRDVAAMADYWRRIGIEVDEPPISPTQVADREFRATYSGWEATAGSSNMIAAPPASAENRWIGRRSGYDNPAFQALLNRFENTVVESERLQLQKAIGEEMAREVSIMPVFYTVEWIGVRKGVKAFQADHEGGYTAAQVGTYARNAHLWDLE